MEAFKTRMNKGPEPNLYFYRDSSQKEIDLVYKAGRALTPIEIKAAMTFNPSLHKTLCYFQKISGAEQGVLIYAGELELQKGSLEVLNFMNTHQLFE